MVNFKCGLTLEELERETGKLVSDLAFYARRPVNIQLVAGKHIAFTYGTDKLKKPIPVVMNPQVLENIRNKERALKVWRGIGFHELSHHLWPADEQYKAANTEGFQHLFNLVDDEQNERRGRALDPSWGACFQSVCAHIFPTRDNARVSTGLTDGGVEEKKPWGVAADKVYSKRWGTFAYHFRRHIPGCTDPVVAKALALIPADFKELPKEELFDLTRKIHQTLCTGIELSEQAPPVEPEQQPEEEEKKEDEQEQETQEDKPIFPSPGWNIKRLLKSKWMLVPLGLFIVGWSALFLQKDLDFWLQVALAGGMALIGITVFLFLRRSLIKSRLAALKAKGAAADKRPIKKAFIGLLCTLILSICAYLYFVKGLRLPIEWLYTGGTVALFAGLLHIGNKLSKHADESGKPLSWLTYLLMTPGLLISLAGLFFVIRMYGLNWYWTGAIVSAAGFIALCLLSIMTGSGKSTERNRTYSLSERVHRGSGPLMRLSLRVLSFFSHILWLLVGKPLFLVLSFLYKVIARCLLYLWSLVTRFFRFIWHYIRRAFWKLKPYLVRWWRNPYFRLAVIAMPIAAIGIIIYALVVKAASLSWWLLTLLILLLLLLLALLYFFRRQISRFILNELFMPMPDLMQMFIQPPLDMTTDWFVQIDDVAEVEADQQVVDEILPETFALASQLRKYLVECGSALVDRDDQPDGHDLIDEAELALLGEPNIFVDDDRYTRTSVHLEVALDCSGSMASPTSSLPAGEKFRLGKLFAMVIEQAVVNLPGVSARFWGFTSDTIFDCGNAGERKISGLKCGGGNNDAAMLWKMSQSARQSGKEVKILLMLSDGQPSECSWLSLRNLVLKLEQEGMIPWNFALDVIDTPAFERFFTDLVGQSKDEAVLTMGQTLAAIAQSCHY